MPDHETLLPRLAEMLVHGGRLAIAMPDNLDEPSHRLMRDVAANGPWRERLGGTERTLRHDAQWYYTQLKPHCERVDVWRTTYHHPLEGGIDAVIEWFKGSALRPMLAKLSADEPTAFLDRSRESLKSAYMVLADGAVLLPFPRLFIVATG